MEGEGGRVFRSCYRTRWDKDERGKDERGVRLANTKVCQGCTEVLGIGELLLSIH